MIQSIRPHDPTRAVRRYPPAGIGLLRAHKVTLECGTLYIVFEYPNRLAIRTMNRQPITSWWHMQLVKQAIWGDRHAVEIFPPGESVIDHAPTRHLWWSPEIERACQECSWSLHASLCAETEEVKR